MYMLRVADRVKHVEETVHAACARSGREPEDVRLVVVTKSADVEAIKEVVQLGYTHLGENRVQQLKKIATQLTELLEQQEGGAELARGIHWHMIGHLQRNKVRQVLPMVSLIHSVDTLRLAEEISVSGAKLNLPQGAS